LGAGYLFSDFLKFQSFQDFFLAKKIEKIFLEIYRTFNNLCFLSLFSGEFKMGLTFYYVIIFVSINVVIESCSVSMLLVHVIHIFARIAI
jgi:hypothetical protein